jgi:quercetin dioxygenase-like cupin family protein
MRRVVTGHTPDGKSTIASDTEVDTIIVRRPSGDEMFSLCTPWETNEMPVFPNDGSPPRVQPRPPFPPVGGFRFGILTFPPKTNEIGGMHTTDTIDLAYIISGEVWLELDDGKEVQLKPGDILIQNGTHHAWHNRGAEPCVSVSCMIGVQRN